MAITIGQIREAFKDVEDHQQIVIFSRNEKDGQLHQMPSIEVVEAIAFEGRPYVGLRRIFQPYEPNNAAPVDPGKSNYDDLIDPS